MIHTCPEITNHSHKNHPSANHIKSNRVVITRHDVFIGKCYIYDDLFKLSLMLLSINKKSSISFFVANVECYDMWHARLEHVNLNSIKRMMSLKLFLISEM